MAFAASTCDELKARALASARKSLQRGRRAGSAAVAGRASAALRTRARNIGMRRFMSSPFRSGAGFRRCAFDSGTLGLRFSCAMAMIRSFGTSLGASRMSEASMLKRTPLYENHRRAGAKLVEFAGWEMPVQYSGVMEEHRTVRTAAGLFDV